MTNLFTKTYDPIPLFIAGEQRLGGGDLTQSYNPATGEVIATLHAPNLDDVNEAITASNHAFCNSDWAKRKPHERASVLYQIAQIIRTKAESLAKRQLEDNGKPIQETRALVASAAATFQFFAAACETLEDKITPQRGDYLSMSIHEPMGVIAAIT